MKKTKEKHTSPGQYRIVWSAGDSVTSSTQYYSVSHSSEALADVGFADTRGALEDDVFAVG